MPYKEKEVRKIYFKIEEVVRITGLRAPEIRNASNKLDQKMKRVRGDTDRAFTMKQIEEVLKAYYLYKKFRVSFKKSRQLFYILETKWISTINKDKLRIIEKYKK